MVLIATNKPATVKDVVIMADLKTLTIKARKNKKMSI